MKFTYYLYAFTAYFFMGCNIPNKALKETSKSPIDGKWGITAYGSTSNMHMSFRIVFFTDGTGNCFHHRDSSLKVGFTYNYDSKNSKLTLKYDSNKAEYHKVNGILEGYKVFSCKNRKIRLGNEKFFALELLTEENKLFVLIRPVSHSAYWEETF